MIAKTLALIVGLVANAQIASAVHSSAHGQRSLITYTSPGGDECPTERAACFGDSSCSTCMDAFNADFNGCTPPAEPSTCDEVDHFLCCAVRDCTNNAAFTDYVACVAGAQECDSFKAIACVVSAAVLDENDDESSDDDDDGEEDDDDDSDDYDWDEDSWEDSIGDSSDSDSDSDSATPSFSRGAPMVAGAALLLATAAAAGLARV
ncbi:unnamed protein product [Scytosiphon promiscuus]